MRESWPWKRELRLLDSKLSVWEVEHRVIDPMSEDAHRLEEIGFQIEKSVFLAAYIIRKLFENHKLANSVSEMLVECFESRYSDSQEERLIGSLIDHDFDHENISKSSLSLHFLCNEIIHAKSFQLGTTNNDSHIEGFFVCSDRNSLKRILYIKFDEFRRQIELVVKNKPRSANINRNASSGKIVWKGE